MKKFISSFSAIASVLSKIAGTILILLAFVVFVHVILRSVFNSGVPGVYEMVQYGMLVVVSLTLAENELTGGSIVVSFIIDKFKPRVTNIFSIAAYCLTICGMSVVLYYQIRMIFQKYRQGAHSPVLYIPHWILVIFICIGLLFFVIAFFIRAYNMIAGHKDIVNVKLTLEEKAAATQVTSEF